MIVRLAAPAAALLALVSTGRSAWSSEISWRKDLVAASRESAANSKPLLLMVKARWCGPCHKMLQQSFPDPAVTARVNAGFIPLLVDADEQSSLIQKLNINAFPTMLVLDSNQRVVERVTGFQTAAQLKARLAAYRPAEHRIAQRPVSPAPRPGTASHGPALAQVAGAPAPVATRPPAPRRPSFHDRAWAKIRGDVPAGPSVSPAPGLYDQPPRDTYTAALEFSRGE
ncbi:MAG: thioredoxin fold domain-containing protein [Planctomycetia bacterium]|nr:thioredoxin fold domain-containing protein [Planctomycetia bacterium]